MGILSRVAQVMSANFNALLDKVDDPKKSLDQTLSDMREQLSAARKETVSAMAAEKQLEQRLIELDRDVDKWTQRAELAVKGNDDALAREALLQKRRLVAERDRTEATRAEQRAAAVEMKEVLARMEQQQKMLEMRGHTIATRVQQAKAGGGAEGLGQRGGVPNAFDEFRRMEEKIEHVENSALAEREVRALLDGRPPGGLSPADLEAKFRALEASAPPASEGASGSTGGVEDELRALKTKIRIAT